MPAVCISLFPTSSAVCKQGCYT